MNPEVVVVKRRTSDEAQEKTHAAGKCKKSAKSSQLEPPQCLSIRQERVGAGGPKLSPGPFLRKARDAKSQGVSSPARPHSCFIQPQFVSSRRPKCSPLL